MYESQSQVARGSIKSSEAVNWVRQNENDCGRIFWIQFSFWIFYICASNRCILELVLRTNWLAYRISIVQRLVAKAEMSQFWRVTYYSRWVDNSLQLKIMQEERKGTSAHFPIHKYMGGKQYPFLRTQISFIFVLSPFYMHWKPNYISTPPIF